MAYYRVPKTSMGSQLTKQLVFQQKVRSGTPPTPSKKPSLGGQKRKKPKKCFSLQYIYNDKILFPIGNLIDQHQMWVQKELENLISSYKLVSFTLANQEEKDLLKDSKKKLLDTMEMFNTIIN